MSPFSSIIITSKHHIIFNISPVVLAFEINWLKAVEFRPYPCAPPPQCQCINAFGPRLDPTEIWARSMVSNLIFAPLALRPLARSPYAATAATLKVFFSFFPERHAASSLLNFK